MDSKQIARALGASRTQALADRDAQGPLGLLQLRAEVAQRLHSSGGRPTDPDWTMRRVIPFDPDRWAELQALSDRLSAEGRAVSAGQLAAMLVEHGLNELERAIEAGDDPLNTFKSKPKQAS